jgi:predicted metal-binding protein
MKPVAKIGIVICDRYRRCAGGKCFRAMKNKDGAFSKYRHTEIELVGFTTCDGCPGGNIEYAGEEMVKNGAEIIHLATGMIVGYPPCSHIDTFKAYLEERYGVRVVVGTHPIPNSYFDMHSRLGTWKSHAWWMRITPTMSDSLTRDSYD